MPRGNWFSIIALIGLGLLLLASVGYYRIQDAQTDPYPDARHNPARNASEPVPSKDNQVSPPAYDPRCHRPQSRDDSDLCAQWGAVEAMKEANRITQIALRAGWFEFMALMVSIFFTGWAAIAASRAAKIAEDATKDADRSLSIAETSANSARATADAMTAQVGLMANAQRPWLDFDIEVTGISQYPVDKPKGSELAVSVKITNHSDYPAHFVLGAGRGGFYGTGLLAATSQGGDQQWLRDFLIDTRRDKLGDVVFPKQPGETPILVELADPDSLSKSPNNSTVTIIVGLRYRFEGGSGYTQRSFFLFGVPGFVNAHLEDWPVPPIKVLASTTGTIAT